MGVRIDREEHQGHSSQDPHWCRDLTSTAG